MEYDDALKDFFYPTYSDALPVLMLPQPLVTKVVMVVSVVCFLVYCLQAVYEQIYDIPLPYNGLQDLVVAAILFSPLLSLLVSFHYFLSWQS